MKRKVISLTNNGVVESLTSKLIINTDRSIPGLDLFATIQGYSGKFNHEIKIPQSWLKSFPTESKEIKPLTKWVIQGLCQAGMVNGLHDEAMDLIMHYSYALEVASVLIDKFDIDVDLNDTVVRDKLILLTFSHDLGTVFNASSLRGKNKAVAWHGEIGAKMIEMASQSNSSITKAMAHVARTHGSAIGYNDMANKAMDITDKSTYITDIDPSISDLDKKLIYIVGLSDAINNVSGIPKPLPDFERLELADKQLMGNIDDVYEGRNIESAMDNIISSMHTRFDKEHVYNRNDYVMLIGDNEVDRVTKGDDKLLFIPELEQLSTRELIKALRSRSVDRSVSFLPKDISEEQKRKLIEEIETVFQKEMKTLGVDVSGKESTLNIDKKNVRSEKNVIFYPSVIKGVKGTFKHEINIPKEWFESYPKDDSDIDAVMTWMIEGIYESGRINGIRPGFEDGVKDQALDLMAHYDYALHLSRILVDNLEMDIDLDNPEVRKKLILYTMAHDLGRMFDASTVRPASHDNSKENRHKMQWHGEIGAKVLEQVSDNESVVRKSMIHIARNHGTGIGYYRASNKSLDIANLTTFLADFDSDIPDLDKKLMILVAFADAFNNSEKEHDRFSEYANYSVGEQHDYMQAISDNLQINLDKSESIDVYVHQFIDAFDDALNVKTHQKNDEFTIELTDKKASKLIITRKTEVKVDGEKLYFNLAQLQDIEPETVEEYLKKNTALKCLGYLGGSEVEKQKAREAVLKAYRYQLQLLGVNRG